MSALSTHFYNSFCFSIDGCGFNNICVRFRRVFDCSFNNLIFILEASDTCLNFIEFVEYYSRVVFCRHVAYLLNLFVCLLDPLGNCFECGLLDCDLLCFGFECVIIYRLQLLESAEYQLFSFWEGVLARGGYGGRRVKFFCFRVAGHRVGASLLCRLRRLLDNDFGLHRLDREKTEDRFQAFTRFIVFLPLGGDVDLFVSEMYPILHNSCT